ncbi:helix-turn-helix domain-containing protein [Amycolatopsis sp. NPDC059021]|uniref:helix-turn-helix domain-containing protein n=1 Tax=Amycolatopsis sp. NPDC059021 TaxID=3346704 RepID=UPI0036712A4B
MADITPKRPAPPVGEALRRARESRGISQRKLGVLVGHTSPGLVSRWESGDRDLSPEDAQGVIDALGLNEEEAEELLALARGAGQTRRFAVTLPERRAELAELLAAERTATNVIQVAPLQIPGILQTADVIRSQMRAAAVPEQEIDERTFTRIGRRDLITRRKPAHLEVLLGEAALLHRIADKDTWADQLRYLNDMGELPNVDIRIVGFDSGWSPLLVGAYMLIESDQAAPIVSLDLHGSGLTLRSAGDIARHRQDADAVREKAMSPAATAELIAKVLHELEQG